MQIQPAVPRVNVRGNSLYLRRATMKAPKGIIVRDYRMLLGILAALLLSLPANAANWKSMAPLPVAAGNAAVESISGIIYVAGGGNHVVPNSTLQAFNPETNTWTALANMPLTLYQGDGAGVINSQLYVAGGWNGPVPPTRCSCTIRPRILGRLWLQCRT